MKKIKSLMFLMILSLLLTGCPQKRILEDIGIINARGVDINNEDQIKSNFVMFTFEEQSENVTQVVSGTGNTSLESVDDANYEANFLLELGKVQVDLYGKEAAKKGISPYIDILNRYANTSDTMYLAVSDTTAEEIIKMQDQNISINIGQYLHDVIDKSSVNEQQFPKMSLQKFMLYNKDVGPDPILPVFEVINGKPKITSIGVFQNDKFVGKLSIHDRLLFNFHYGRVKREWPEFSIPAEPFKSDLKDNPLGDEDSIDLNLSAMNNKSKVKLLDKDNLKFKHNIEIEGDLIDLSVHEQLDLENTKVLKKLEREIEKSLKKRYEKLLDKLQEFNADPLGYGEIYRQNSRGEKLTDKKWRKKFPDIEVDYDIDVDIIRHGETF